MRPDAARQVRTLNRRQVDALLISYREALEELRSWRDPGVAALIVRLESLRLLAARQLRYLNEEKRMSRSL